MYLYITWVGHGRIPYLLLCLFRLGVDIYYFGTGYRLAMFPVSEHRMSLKLPALYLLPVYTTEPGRTRPRYLP